MYWTEPVSWNRATFEQIKNQAVSGILKLPVIRKIDAVRSIDKSK